ncbi:hypothetical protein XTPLMG728_3597 [Xanthomonas translucens pv. poae]|uniref:G-D-S-L family lipolytic protein n=1 Tax=Xanthomonas graminis pv. poae TaxID=227946 RepID=A0A0K3A5V9_9XANT|nr:SGNH/GDSL hydrolase family protein [Xanthomonas translucens]UKE63131.1 hypothetical protein KM539_06595 [Xanthomonas translucens pv. poae]CTP93228.1 hypothetical protein XTPLMG728_3597 [Xanthomonas translucens pv. poae]
MNAASTPNAYGARADLKDPPAIRAALTHKEAVAEVYRLTPQLREYDEFMYLGVRWLPYTMFFHLRNYRSDVINTDELGFRFTDSHRGRASMADFPDDVPVNLLIGGSTALGTGTTCDSATTASKLAKLTGEIWLNLGGRGYNATQELILFLMHQHRFKEIKNVVLLSGANTLTLEGLPDELACEHGRYYYSYEFNHYMEAYNDDIKRRRNSYGSKVDGSGKWLFARASEHLKKAFNDVNHSEKVINDGAVDINERVERAAWVTSNALRQWQLLLAPYGARLSYFLQPISRWTKDKFHGDEEDMFHAIDYCPNNFWRLFGNLCASELHAPYANGIAAGCADIGVPFWDMNALLRTSPVIHNNIYVDHLHFNDEGYGEMARLIHQAVSPTQELAV